MKPKKVELPSVYEPKQFKKTGLKVNIFHLIGLLVILLVVFRFVNLTLWWFMGKLELKNLVYQPAKMLMLTKNIHYTFLDFSNYKKAEKKCREFAQKRPGDNTIHVAAYFNLLHPGIFLIQNNNGNSFVDLGRIIVTTAPGFSTFTLYLSDFIEKRYNHKVARKHLGTSLLLSTLLPHKQQDPGNRITFILKPSEKLKYLDIPYLLYFYLPLVLILIFSHMYSRAVFLSFFYYSFLFLLFDFRAVLFTVPFNWVMESFDLVPSGLVETWGAIVVALLFTLLGIIGIFSWKKQQNIFKERLIVLFFLLLPLFLRF
ncbi:MAG: hypothetical protein GTO45_41270 [Candidatus Aminicenantes bacterium]|nr:hypothetical protein [Candidatus Aminicenantes bacterium]NIM85036.1 hypothetical protein [Candidatus Aminicenantes bacterium]NIN24550.1 hypothetical protein [Candidatus Aminicenantes bacterium]NIN48314.1 hypothetical protein [Candidatus Aminicenantes bacterium]NIN91217.1 hypothetical protein [Candidatus Aminicenantes bacterium]